MSGGEPGLRAPLFHEEAVKLSIKEVCAGVYRNEITLPGNALRALNSYIIPSEERSLIIGTGYGLPECRDAMLAGIEACGIDIAKTDLLLTHLHPDHCGLASELQSLGARVLAGRTEIESSSPGNAPRGFDFGAMIKLLGLDTDKVRKRVSQPGDLSRREYVPKHFHCEPLDEGDVLRYGDFRLRVADVPGHTRGQIGLYDAVKRLFFCGDHILASTSPNVTYWDSGDALGTYLASLDKVYQLDIALLLPAHGELIGNSRERIDQLRAHHCERLDEVMGIIRDSPRTVVGTGSRLKWNVTCIWRSMSNVQGMFALGEAWSNLEHLVATGSAVKTLENGTAYYRAL